MATFNVFLVQKYDNWEYFGEGDAYAVGNYLIDFFDQVCKGSKSFDKSDYWYNPKSSQIGSRDLVCYLLPSSRRSIVARHTSEALGAGGSTVLSPKNNTVISEVYMTSIDGDASKARLLANIIIHELMHNKLDAQRVVRDVHNIAGGRVSAGSALNSSSTPNDADVKAMRQGIDLAIPQHTGDL